MIVERLAEILGYDLEPIMLYQVIYFKLYTNERYIFYKHVRTYILLQINYLKNIILMSDLGYDRS